MDDRKDLLRRFCAHCLAHGELSLAAVGEGSLSEAIDETIESFLADAENLPHGPWYLYVVCTGKGNGGEGCSYNLSYTRDDVIDTNPACLPRRKTYGVACRHCGTVTDIDHDNWPPDLKYKYEKTMGRI